jgi:hypothetical protein
LTRVTPLLSGGQFQIGTPTRVTLGCLGSVSGVEEKAKVRAPPLIFLISGDQLGRK